MLQDIQDIVTVLPWWCNNIQLRSTLALDKDSEISKLTLVISPSQQQKIQVNTNTKAAKGHYWGSKGQLLEQWRGHYWATG